MELDTHNSYILTNFLGEWGARKYLTWVFLRMIFTLTYYNFEWTCLKTRTWNDQFCYCAEQFLILMTPKRNLNHLFLLSNIITYLCTVGDSLIEYNIRWCISLKLPAGSACTYVEIYWIWTCSPARVAQFVWERTLLPGKVPFGMALENLIRRGAHYWRKLWSKENPRRRGKRGKALNWKGENWCDERWSGGGGM